MFKYFILSIIVFSFLVSCSSDTSRERIDSDEQENNPASPGFDLANSDSKAVAIADSVMERMGGRKAWDETKIISWNFFGARTLTWNKQNGNVRIQFDKNDSNVILTNIFDHTGKVKLDGEEQLDQDSIIKYTQMAESIWINDSYWLLMPFKLKDSKTTLKYLTIDTTEAGEYSHILELTFNEIGDTPNNKYWVYVDTLTMLVNEWAYFNHRSDTLPRFKTPWGDYKRYGKLLLAGDRGKRDITEIEVLETLPETIFTEF